MSNTFWDGDSDLQDVADALATLIPPTGAVENPKKNKALEKFRRATNCYYDLYNNGLCNRRQEFYRLFEVRVSNFKFSWPHKRRGRIDFDRIMPVVEPIMRQFVLDAAAEQKIEITTTEEVK